MENSISVIETAQQPLERFSMGACSHALAQAVPSASNRAIAVPRPRIGTAACLAEQNPALAASGFGAWLQLSTKQYAHMALISASGDGELGSHPAREPV